MLGINMLSNCGYALAAPFLPLQLASRDISVQWCGYIFGIYSVAVCLFSPLVGHALTKFKARRFMVRFGLVCMATALLGYALAPIFITSKPLLISSFLGLRFL